MLCTYEILCEGVKRVKTNGSCPVGVLGVLVGSAVGYVASETLQEPQEVVTQTQVVQEELSNEDLEELCKGLTDEEKKNVLEVQEVKLLQMTLADREAELEKLKEQKYKTEKARKAARAKWKAMEEEIATLQIDLQLQNKSEMS